MNSYTLYTNYFNLMNFYIKTDLKQAILVGKALLSEEEIEKIPYVLQKQLIFNLGTAYLLEGNYRDAKKRFREVLKLQPNNHLRGMALNNLALAYRW